MHGQWAVQLLNIYLLPTSCRLDKSLVPAVTFNDSAVWAAFTRSDPFAREPLSEVTGGLGDYLSLGRLLGWGLQAGGREGTGLEGTGFCSPGLHILSWGQSSGGDLRRRPGGTELQLHALVDSEGSLSPLSMIRNAASSHLSVTFHHLSLESRVMPL